MIELEKNLFLPIAITAVSGVFAAGAVLYTKIRPHICVTVNCWFCNQNSRVPLTNKNSFTCSSCCQYNGFTKDGDYNSEIPAQRKENLNHSYTTHRRNSPKSSSPVSNGLCHTCNVNQSLKVKSLAEYEPYSQENYDMELEDYKQRLDRMFSLCRDCEGVLHQTLGKQNSWLKPLLISYRLMQSKKHILKLVTSVSHGSIYGTFVKTILLLQTMTVLLSVFYQSVVPDKYLLLQYEPRLSSFYTYGKENLSAVCLITLLTMLMWLVSHGRKMVYAIDYFCVVLWTALLGVSSSSFSLQDFSDMALPILAVLTFFVTTLTVFRRRTIPTWKNSSAKRIHMNEHDISNYNYDSTCNDDPLMNSSFTTALTGKSENTFHSVHRTPSESTNETKCSTPSKLDDDVSSDKSDLGFTFGGLKIGTPLKNNRKSFSPKSLFSDRNHKILAEPKLFSKVTQASWVAGGYWGPSGSPQKGRSHPSVRSELIERQIPSFSSRSSSLSSGFISQTSGTFNSQMDSGRASVCSEQDRASLLSESASMYPSSVNNERFNGSRSPTMCSAASCGFSHCDFPSRQASLFNEHTPSCHDFSMPLNTSNRSQSDANGVNVYERFYSKCCNPLVAFILGISMTANFFLFFNNMNK